MLIVIILIIVAVLYKAHQALSPNEQQALASVAFRGFHEIDFDPPTIAFAPDVFRLGASLVAEAARILTGYVPAVSIGTQVELDFLAGSTESIVEWPRYPDDCPTCGDGDESAWPVFSLYPGSTWRTPVSVGEPGR